MSTKATEAAGDYGVVTAPGTIRFERVLPGPIERVWAYVTEAERRATWFAGGTFELRVGGRIELHFDHRNITTEPTPDRYKDVAEGRIARGEVTRCEPPFSLSFTWWEDDGSSYDEVSFELTPQGESVLLVLTHARLDDRAAMISVVAGWHVHLAILEAWLRGYQAGPFWSSHARLEREYERRIEATDPSAPTAAPEQESIADQFTNVRRPLMKNLQLTHAPFAKTEMLIRKPVSEVFEAFVNPAITSKFWFTKGSGTLEAGKQLRWDWEMYNHSVRVNVKAIEENRRILVEWEAYGTPSTVEWVFASRSDNTTLVSVTDSGFSGGGDEVVKKALDSTGGFALVLAGAKAFLEHGMMLNLIADRFPDGH